MTFNLKPLISSITILKIIVSKTYLFCSKNFWKIFLVRNFSLWKNLFTYACIFNSFSIKDVYKCLFSSLCTDRHIVIIYPRTDQILYLHIIWACIYVFGSKPFDRIRRLYTSMVSRRSSAVICRY